MSRKAAIFWAVAGALLCFAYAAWATLPASGQISFSQVNTELSLSSTAQISLNQTAVRTLAAVPSGQISMNDLHGKSASTSGTFTAGFVSSPPNSASGYDSTGAMGFGTFGSAMSPATIKDGRTITAIAELDISGPGLSTHIRISGFSSDPGITGYATTFTVNTYSVAASSATYSYGGSVAQWSYPGNVFVLPTFGSVSFTVSY